MTKKIINNKKENPQDYPFLGRVFHALHQPPVAKFLLWGLIALCVGLLGWNAFYKLHGHFTAETIYGFYAVFGFTAFTIVIFGAKTLRYFLGRAEDYYGEKSVDTEDYPPKQTEKKDV